MLRTANDRKKEAKKLIKNYHRDTPANVQHTPAKRFDFARWAVALDDLVVHFQEIDNRLWYLGEYPPNQD